MSLDFNFCSRCGSPSKEQWTGFYDQTTGEKRTRSVCAADPCHTDHDRELQPLFAKGDWKCKRCGELGWYGFCF